MSSYRNLFQNQKKEEKEEKVGRRKWRRMKKREGEG